jgi:hypothetical protein
VGGRLEDDDPRKKMYKRGSTGMLDQDLTAEIDRPKRIKNQALIHIFHLL